jgi:ATP-dependent RNA helicase DDX27
MVIPVAMEGRDVCAAARTGSGKTAAFVLPILERLLHRSRRSVVSRVLILLPTRELATQVCFSPCMCDVVFLRDVAEQCTEVVSVLGKFTDVRCCCIIGGVSLSKQELDLRAQPEIIVATPGRLIDLLRNSQVTRRNAHIYIYIPVVYMCLFFPTFTCSSLASFLLS